jgi:hypothetical protein
MRWVQTTKGEKAHVVVTGAKETLCGIGFEHVVAIVSPGPDDRCGNCDKWWREIGRKERRTVNKPRRRDVYSPKHKTRWE